MLSEDNLVILLVHTASTDAPVFRDMAFDGRRCEANQMAAFSAATARPSRRLMAWLHHDDTRQSIHMSKYRGLEMSCRTPRSQEVQLRLNPATIEAVLKPEGLPIGEPMKMS